MCSLGRVKSFSIRYSEGQVKVRSERSISQFHKCQQKCVIRCRLSSEIRKRHFILLTSLSISDPYSDDCSCLMAHWLMTHYNVCGGLLFDSWSRYKSTILDLQMHIQFPKARASRWYMTYRYVTHRPLLIWGTMRVMDMSLPGSSPHHSGVKYIIHHPSIHQVHHSYIHRRHTSVIHDIYTGVGNH